MILPGGFSYGDYLRAGAIAARSPMMDAVREFAGRGGAVLGVCNEFEILWPVPPEHWGDIEHQAPVLPLDLDAELARFG